MKTYANSKEKSKSCNPSPSFARSPFANDRGLSEQREAIRNILSPQVQKKVAVGQAGDRFEREADAVADKVAAGEAAPLISRINSSSHTDNTAQRQTEIDDDEETVQAKAKDEELEEKKVQTKLIQREVKSEELDEEVQTKSKEEDEEKIQAKSNTSSSAPSKSSAAANAINNKGPGSPINPPTRKTLESGMGTDFSQVRVHDDSAAKKNASNLNARAFTHKNDIWLGEGESQSDTKLMAHEATHVVQQTGLVQRVIQRAERATSITQGEQETEETVDAANLPYKDGRREGDVITFDEVEVPAFKLEAHRRSLYNARRLRQKKSYVRKSQEGKDPAQRSLWKEEISKNSDQIVARLEEKAKRGLGTSSVNADDIYVFKGITRHGADRFFIGDLSVVAKELTLPSWDKKGGEKSYDVDHIVELQLANWNDDPWGNTLPNMELLDSSINKSSGSSIKASIDRKVNGFIKATNGQYGNSVNEVKGTHHIEFQSAVTAKGGSISENDYWVKNDIQEGSQVDSLTLSSMADLGGTGKVMLYPDITGGQPKGFVWPGEDISSAERNWIKPFVITAKQFNAEAGSENSEQIGSLSFNIPETHPELEQFADGDQTLPIKRIQGARYAGYLDKSIIRRKLNQLKIKRLSPVEITSFDILPEGGIYAAGQILPDVSLFKGSGIDFELSSNNLTFYKLFQSGDFQMPAPFEIIDSSLTISLSTETGFGVEGRADFGIHGLGEGYFGAGANTVGGLNLEGGFNFDSNLFDPSEVSMKYENDVFSMEGRLGINERKVRGVKSAEITVAYSEGQLSVAGAAQLAVPGIQKGNLSYTYSETEGVIIGGAFQLSNDIPGIESGSVEGRISKSPEDETWKLAARGTAVPSIPGIDSSIDVSYEDGLFNIEGEAAYERGMLSGSILIGATNRVVDKDGNPTDQPGKNVTAYGGGTVTVKIAPWLKGTVGLKLLPNGETEIAGKIQLDDALDLFERKELKKDIFKIPTIDIPIFGVSLFGKRVGIFASIGGGMDLNAGVGPGQLRDLALSINYNPDHEDQTRVTGGAKLVIPANAGLRFYVTGSVGAGLLIVSAQVGLEIGGELGLEGAAEAGVELDWTPAKGLVIDAFSEIYVEPKFRFDLTGFALVEADLLLTTIELYKKRWELMAFEFGPDLRFGMTLPIHYEENQPFELSWDNVKFDVPTVDKDEMMDGLIKKVV